MSSIDLLRTVLKFKGKTISKNTCIDCKFLAGTTCSKKYRIDIGSLKKGPIKAIYPVRLSKCIKEKGKMIFCIIDGEEYKKEKLMTKKRRIRKIIYGGKLYQQRIIQLADNYLILHPCKTCGSPTVKGYVCIFCDESDP